MKKNLILIVALLINILNVLAKDNYFSTVRKVEHYIITNNLDSAKILLQNNAYNDKSYYASLKQIVFSNSPSYHSYSDFIHNYSSNNPNTSLELQFFINQRIYNPSNKTFDFEYFHLKHRLLKSLREDNQIDIANNEHENLIKYVNQFDEDEKHIIQAKGYLLAHSIVLSQIAKNSKKANDLCEKMKALALKSNDNELLIAYYFHVSETYFIDGKLDDYINAGEKALTLELKQQAKSPYYGENLSNLVNALIFKKGNTERVFKLLEEMHADEDLRRHSYYLYLDLIAEVKLESQIAEKIFNKFKVDDIIQLCDTIHLMSKDALNGNDYYYVLEEASTALRIHEFYKESIKYSDLSILVIKKLYSKDLSTALASFEATQIRKEKQKELDFEKDKTQLFLIIGVLSLMFLIILGYAYARKSKQQKVIEKKDNEKALLLKEIHHRVKNNFQIISSLLQLQTKRIEDKDALGIVVEGQNRVKSMALIHQKLYQNDDLVVDFKDYLQDLILEINKTFSNYKIESIININNDYSLDIDTAIPLGLIVNELITNSFKYAFNPQNENRLTISLIENKIEHQLIITDSGKGLSKDFELSSSKSLGLRLVKNLSKQLHGRLKYQNNNGAEFTIFFKETHLRNLVD